MTASQDQTQNSYSARLYRVEKIVEELGSNNLNLDEVVGKVEEGYKLIAELKQKLGETKLRVEQLRQKFEESETKE